MGVRDVFISHSARDDAFATDVLEKIQEQLKAKGFRPLVDQEGIHSGQEWQPQIVDWLARCDAAVVLLNEKALCSTWVRREVNILMWRRALGAHLTVVPVLLGGLSTSTVKAAGMEELRPVQFARTPRGSKPDAEELAALVLQEFAHLPEPLAGADPMSRWLDSLALYLAEAQSKSDLLVAAARALAVEEKYLADVTAQQGGCHFLAHQFMVAPPERMERALKVLAPSLTNETLRRLTAALTATWVNEEAARRVLPTPARPPHEMTILLNARRGDTAKQYIRRATCGATWGYEVESVGVLPTGEDRVGELFRDLEQAVWEQFFEADSEEDRVFPSDLAERTHYLVINQSRLPDGEFAKAVNRLHNVFSWLIVLVTTGTAVPDAQVRAAFKSSVLLKPLLTAEDEKTASLRNSRLTKLPDRLAGA